EAMVAANVDARAARFNAEAIDLAQKGDFEAAVTAMRRARAIDSNDPTLTKNLQTMLTAWASQALRDDDVDAAVDRLNEAASLGDDAEVLYGVGLAQLRREEAQAAIAALARGAALAPKDSRFPLAQAEAYLKLNQRAEALAALQHAHELGARGGDLDRRIERLGREVDAEWDYVERESSHFQISFADGEDSGVVHTVLDAFEDAYDQVGSKFSRYPDARTAIVLYTQQDFHSITHTPDWAGGAYDGRIKLPVRGLNVNDESLARVARHEYAHSIITNLSSGRCPVWLNEGLAVWAEEARDGDHTDWAEGKIADRPLIPLAALNRSFSTLGETDAELAYAESYLAARALIERHGMARMKDFLADVAHQSTEDAYRSAFDEDLSAFEDRLRHDLGAS
ncbi:MAG TPA: peptidase MA family metallohydrolase, partial [Candidatus Acidoferrales bacterium]|nr:peptidase MA family metallohydrolase [Candidatus Acidoferrales bacterium]